MPLVVGTDEAGYAPNLGPLVVAATCWRVPRTDFDFYSELRGLIRGGDDPADDRLLIADSKSVYQSGGSIVGLETGVLALLASRRARPADVAELVAHLTCPRPTEIPSCYEWAADAIPLCDCADDVDRHARRLNELFERRSIQRVRMAARVVFPEEFNSLIAAHGNKGALLSAVTLELVHQLTGETEEECLIVCDRHGGRARYAPLIQQFLTEQWPAVVEERSVCSRYRWSEQGRATEIRFVVRGESFLPTAAASMTAKYLREVLMRGWNEFWTRRDREIRPTAGYPADAKRFLHEVRPHLDALGIDETRIWRSR